MLTVSEPHVLALEVCVTTCCGRDLTWLGELFSHDGWQVTRQRHRQLRISLPALLGPHARLHIYNKGGNESDLQSLLHRVRARAAHPQSVSATLLPNANGREAHTIAHHIAENWDRLALVTTFVQGDMKADHMEPLVMLHDGLADARRLIESRRATGMGRLSGHASDVEREMVRHMAEAMNSAAPSTSAACLCHASETPPLLCEAGSSSPDYQQWPCPETFRQARVASGYQLQHLGGYTSLMGFVMRHFLHEDTWPAMAVPWCNAGSLSVTAHQAREHKPARWWRALRQLLERDRKIKWVSALRLAHVFERLWLRIFSGAPPIEGSGTRPAGASGRTSEGEPARRHEALGHAMVPRSHSLALPACFDQPNNTCCMRHHECCCPSRRHPPPTARANQHERAGVWHTTAAPVRAARPHRPPLGSPR